MRIIDNARHAWRFLSVQIAAVGMALQAAVLGFPSIKDWLGDTFTHYLGIFMLVGVVAGRLIDQPATKGDCDDNH